LIGLWIEAVINSDDTEPKEEEMHIALPYCFGGRAETYPMQLFKFYHLIE